MESAVVFDEHHIPFGKLCNHKRVFLYIFIGYSGGQSSIEQIIRKTTEENQLKVDWTKAWSTKYPVLKTYQTEVDIPRFADQIKAMLTELQTSYGYSAQDAMLVLKDILAHVYMDTR